jgi:hypothetical protein
MGDGQRPLQREEGRKRPRQEDRPQDGIAGLPVGDRPRVEKHPVRVVVVRPDPPGDHHQPENQRTDDDQHRRCGDADTVRADLVIRADRVTHTGR